MDVFGLLYVNADPERHLNLGQQREDPLDVYLKCAINSGRSFERFGNKYSLITNRPDVVRQRGNVLGLNLPKLVEHEFTRDIPQGLTFASSHRRFEVYEAFGQGKFGTRPVLADLDTELIRPLPTSMVEPGTVHALDLTSVVFGDRGPGVSQIHKTILGEMPAVAIWPGGELLCADAAQYAELAQIIDNHWQRYLTLAGQGNTHQSDETLTAVAVSSLVASGTRFVDAGAEGAVARYWSSRTGVALPPFRVAARAALIHLPADKGFLASRAMRSTDPNHFVRDYGRWVFPKMATRKVLSSVERLVGRDSRKHAPRW